MLQIYRQSDGFTLFELLLIVAIVGIIAMSLIVNMAQSDRELTVQESAQVLVAALREAQNSALGGKKVAGSVPLGGFGVYTKSGSDLFLFADINNNHIYNAGEEQRKILIDSAVSLAPTTDIAITFIPPTPDVLAYASSGAQIGGNDFTITLQRDAVVKIIHVNNAGAIWVQ